MKVRFWCDSGANIYSCSEEIIDLEEWGFAEGEWESLSEDDKYKEVEQWAWNQGLDIGFEEIEED